MTAPWVSKNRTSAAKQVAETFGVDGKDVPQGQKSLRENQPIAKSVPQGRLNLAQDAVLGWHAPSKSPVGTAEKVTQEMVLDSGSGSGLLDRGMFRDGNTRDRILRNFQSSLRDWLISRISPQDYVLG